MRKLLYTLVLASIAIFSYAQETGTNNPAPDLYKTIATMDSTLFAAFNTQNLQTFKSFFTEDLEWYQDNAGLIPYKSVFETFDKNFHNESKIRRELVKGSLEVYPIKDYGAIETGSHRFSHLEDGNEIVGIFKFTMIWKKTDSGWKISRVVSYNH